MSTLIKVVTASNVLAPALAVLQELGYAVSRAGNSPSEGTHTLMAEKPGVLLQAEDPLLLLGLAKLIEVRGSQWQPTNSEVDELLKLTG